MLEPRAEHHFTAGSGLGRELTMDTTSPGWVRCLPALPFADPLTGTTSSLRGLCLPPNGAPPGPGFGCWLNSLRSNLLAMMMCCSDLQCFHYSIRVDICFLRL